MASIKFSSLVSDVRGMIGGVIFARGANGAYVKTFSKSSNRNTPFQSVSRNNLSAYSSKWRELTDIERQSWINAVDQFPYQNRVGAKSTYTGFQLFMRTNLRLEYAALSQ